MSVKMDDKTQQTAAIASHEASSRASKSDENSRPPQPSNVEEKQEERHDALVTVPPIRFWLLSIGIYTGLFLAMMDASIVASSLHTIAADFGVFISVNWAALAYTLTECSFGTIFTRISDLVGRRNAFLLAKSLFFVFSVAGGFAKNLDQLVAFRALQGLGGAGLYSLSLVVLPEVCPDHHLEYMVGVAGLMIVAAGVTGPILGGALTQYASWRWIFWINAPICVISTAFVLMFWPAEEQMVVPPRRSWKSFDYIGSALLIAASVLFVFAFQNVGVSTNRNIWSQPVFIAPVAIGFFSWLALLLWEYALEYTRWGYSVMPIFPLSLFRNRFYAAGVITTLFLGFQMFLVLFSVPLRCQLVSDKSPVMASLMLLPMLGATAVGCLLASVLSIRRNFLFETNCAGALLSVVGCALLITIDGPNDDSKLLGYLALAGLGAGMTISSATLITSSEIPLANYAPAHGILSQVRILGGSFGISTSSVLLHNQVFKRLHGPISSQMLSALGGGGSNKLPPLLQKMIAASTAAAFRNGMIVCCAVSGMAVLLSFIGFRTKRRCIKQQRMDMLRAGLAQASRG